MRPKPKFPKSKKIKKTTLKRKADIEFSKVVREIGYCQAKGKDNVKCGGALQCCHIIGRSNHRLRWDLHNVLCLCAGHHRYYTNRGFAWVEFIQRYYKEKYDYIKKHQNELWDKDYKKVFENIKRKVVNKYGR